MKFIRERKREREREREREGEGFHKIVTMYLLSYKYPSRESFRRTVLTLVAITGQLSEVRKKSRAMVTGDNLLLP